MSFCRTRSGTLTGQARRLRDLWGPGQRLTQAQRLTLRAAEIVELRAQLKATTALADQALELAWAIKFGGRDSEA